MTDLSSGYSQVLKATNGTDTVYYTRGFELISRLEGDASSFYLYDGGLSVRALTDEAGAITDTLVFDAFGNETEKTGTTANTYGFQGEEQDATGLYYLRARYMDPASGTFTSMDTYAGSLSDPMSLHKYLFANSNPVMYSDPSGLFSLADIDASMAIDFILNAGYMSGYLYIIDASITDPQLEHHDFTGYLCAIGFGMLFAALNIVLSATVAGLLILAIIDTALGAAGTIKGVIDFINGHQIYGGLEILSSALLTWFGWRNYTSAVNAAKAVGNTSSTGIGSGEKYSSKQSINNKFPNDNQSGKEYDYVFDGGRIHTKNGVRDFDFIIDMDGNLHIGSGHSYLSKGKNVQAAGTMKINSQGYIRNITNNSGHYQPNLRESFNYPKILKNRGFKMDNSWISINSFSTDGTKYITGITNIYTGPIRYMPKV